MVRYSARCIFLASVVRAPQCFQSIKKLITIKPVKMKIFIATWLSNFVGFVAELSSKTDRSSEAAVLEVEVELEVLR